MDKEQWIRWGIIMGIIVLMWVGIIAFFYLKADEVTKHPCEVCAKKLSKEVYCRIGNSGRIISRTYYPNLTTVDNVKGAILP